MTSEFDKELQRYFRDIGRYPMLSAEREQELVARWRENQDSAALDELVGSHLRLVARVARSFRGYGLPLTDLVAEGNIGLMQAIERFDPDKGFRLSTYALWWIRAAIQEYVLKSWSLVKMGSTASQKKLFFNLRRLKRQIRKWDEVALSPEERAKIATDLGVSENDVVYVNDRLSGRDQSLNAPVNIEDDTEWQDWLVDERDDQESRLMDQDVLSKRRDLVKTAMKKLNARERQILEHRRLSEDPPTLEELAQQYGISRERVRQIEVRAFEKLRQGVRNLTPAAQPA